MTPQELSSSLKSLSEAHREASTLITRLSKLSSTPDTNPSQADETDNRVELSTEIHQSLKEQEEELEILRQEVEDLTSSGHWVAGARRQDSEKDRERLTLITQVERLDEDLKLARIQFRRAQLQAKRNAEAAKRKERELLFAAVQEGHATGPGRRKGQGKLSQDDLLVNASSDVTAALRRTHQLMQAELARSQFARDSLEQSTAALTTLNESYSTLGTLLTSSRSLISSLVSSQKSDTWYLETAFYILVGTIIWLVFRRIFWIPYKAILLMIRVSITAFTALLGAIGGSGHSDSLSSGARQASTSLIVKPSAKGGIPRFGDGMAAPSIAVGGGGDGAKKVPQDEESMVDRVGKMVDDTQQAGAGAGDGTGPGAGKGAGVYAGEGAGVGAGAGAGESGQADQGTVLRERRPDEKPNPKKRMWEEPPRPPQEEKGRVKDEL